MAKRKFFKGLLAFLTQKPSKEEAGGVVRHIISLIAGAILGIASIKGLDISADVIKEGEAAALGLAGSIGAVIAFVKSVSSKRKGDPDQDELEIENTTRIRSRTGRK